MGNCLISFPNRIDAATLTGGSWSASLPRANLADRQLSLVARSSTAAAADTKVLADLGSTYSLRGFALVNHNLTQAAQWRILLGSTSGASDVYSSGWVDVYQMAFDPNLIPWGGAGLWRGIDGDEYVGTDRAAIHVADGWYDARYLTIEISDTANADGYVQVGRLFAGGGVEPGKNMSHAGFSEGYEDRSIVTENATGEEFFDERTPYRVTRLRLEWSTHLEFQRWYEMQRQLGVTGEVLWIPDVDDAGEQQARGFLARMRQLSPIEYPYTATRSIAFDLKELLP